MNWSEINKNPLFINNYDIISKSGVISLVESLQSDIKKSDQLIAQAYEIFTKKTIDELVEYLLYVFSDLFIPSELTFVLNEGVLLDKIKIISYQRMKIAESNLEVKSLKSFESFFEKNDGVSSSNHFDEYLMDSGTNNPFSELDYKIIVSLPGISGLYGILLFGSKILGETYTTQEIEYIDKLVKFFSVAIQNTIHYTHSVNEPKTGLFNHSFFMSRVQQEISRCKRNRGVFAVIIMDIDKFKDFNDTYGHLAGDKVLISIADKLKDIIREEDILSRFGGEEFTVLLPHSGKDEAFRASERFREAIEDLNIEYEENVLKVTVSLGICTYNWVEEIKENELLKRADDALYQSKGAGRNRSTIYKSGLLHRATKFS
ncbi:MAG: hypothetical protein B6229_03050 [Spirochaetaceae bacterium 4572_7]|nr:MAG: hypothetical protein B6229_03050 [Spirochaetaceae bacterium 4572_7]